MIPEPPEHTFAVWFHPSGFCILALHRDDACTNEGRHWHAANLHGRTDNPQPMTWTEACELGRALRLNGPHLLVKADR
ncbi:hypothetical protein ACPB67_02720 [Micromonospora taraxaci]|uniref:hypothetical protein n=1 Tax=Micromonospora taraxaci TaxID=1316803 RepID=UPI003C30DF7B